MSLFLVFVLAFCLGEVRVSARRYRILYSYVSDADIAKGDELLGDDVCVL